MLMEVTLSLGSMEDTERGLTLGIEPEGFEGCGVGMSGEEEDEDFFPRDEQAARILGVAFAGPMGRPR